MTTIAPVLQPRTRSALKTGIAQFISIKRPTGLKLRTPASRAAAATFFFAKPLPIMTTRTLYAHTGPFGAHLHVERVLFSCMWMRELSVKNAQYLMCLTPPLGFCVIPQTYRYVQASFKFDYFATTARFFLPSHVHRFKLSFLMHR